MDEQNINVQQEIKCEQKPQRIFTDFEVVFSWLSLVVGYLFCRVNPVTENSFGGFGFVILIFLFTAIFMRLKGIKHNKMSIAAAVSAIIINFTLLFSDNSLLCGLAYLYCAVAYCYFVTSSGGNFIKKGFNNYIFMDFFKALFVLPFYSFDAFFRAVFSGKAAKSGKVILKIFLGIMLTIIPTAIVLLLLSYDSAFSELLSNIFDFSVVDVFSHIGSLILGIPIASYIFGLYVSSADKKCENVITEQECIKAAEKVGVIPALTCIFAVTPILFLYAVFFISQWDYYISGFTGILPQNFSYANYAREGFFQLCAVSIINLLITTFIGLFMKRVEKSGKIIYKCIAIVFSVFTLILISTAVAKMVMYIDCYGLTQKRVYSTWFMLFLAIVFILLGIRQFASKINTVALSLAVGFVMLSALSLVNADRLIARYNVDRYIDNTLKTVDVSALHELGDPAIPELVRLEKYLIKNKKNATDRELYYVVRDTLSDCERDREGKRLNIFEFDIPTFTADRALESRE